jgi:hypothetical protein
LLVAGLVAMRERGELRRDDAGEASAACMRVGISRGRG